MLQKFTTRVNRSLSNIRHIQFFIKFCCHQISRGIKKERLNRMHCIITPWLTSLPDLNFIINCWRCFVITSDSILEFKFCPHKEWKMMEIYVNFNGLHKSVLIQQREMRRNFHSWRGISLTFFALMHSDGRKLLRNDLNSTAHVHGLKRKLVTKPLNTFERVAKANLVFLSTSHYEKPLLIQLQRSSLHHFTA